MKKLFIQESTTTAQTILAVIFSLILMTVDHRQRSLEPSHSLLGFIISPVQYLINAPFDFASFITERFKSHKTLLIENKELNNKILLYQANQLTLHAKEAEIARLRDLLGSAYRVHKNVLIAEIISIDMGTYSHKIVINKGNHHGVYLNQPVLDAHGIFGKIIHISPRTSQLMLISNPNHGIPVQIQRNGLRSIAFGTGQSLNLELLHLPNNSDIKPGDTLISSGLGGVFPKNYPVATILSVQQSPGQPFAKIFATPKAKLQLSQELILVEASQKTIFPTTKHNISTQKTPQKNTKPLPSPPPPQ
ncbi:MAG: rod shape-determining protein MreC [Methylococcales bacterium]|nr:rod shape-determining protein MreC [Methylococcales bacterium]